ncbi:MAG: O-antigen ligase family protein [Victivallaceae bacterium]|nr:O-antigen ligase family protein [Victivallaceae bacterium]
MNNLQMLSYPSGVLFIFVAIAGIILYFLFRRINAETLSLGLCASLLLLPLPELFWSERILQSVGFLTYENLVLVMTTGLPQVAVLSNVFLLLFAAILATSLILSNSRPRAKFKLTLLATIYFAFCLMRLEISIGMLLSLYIFMVTILFGEFKVWMIKPLFFMSYGIFCIASLTGVFLLPHVCIDLDGKWNGIMLNVNAFTTPLGFTLIMLILLDYYKLCSLRNTLLLSLPLLLLVLMVRSRAAIICFTALMFCFLMIRVHATPLLIVLGFAALFVAIIMVPDEETVDFSSLTSLRWDMWGFCLDAITKHPLLGNGADFFKWENRLEFPLQLRHMGTAFSTFIQVAVCFGMLGFSVLVLFYVMLYKTLSQHKNKMMLLFFILFFLPCTVETSFWPLQCNPSNICYLISLLIIIRIPNELPIQTVSTKDAEKKPCPE